MRARAALALLCAACGGGGGTPAAPDASVPAIADAGAPDGASLPYATLSEYALFVGNGSTQEPAPGVVPYAVNSVLFADYASKRRFIVLPAGGKITYQPDAKWIFPTGTMIVKTFSYLSDLRDPSKGERLIETRLLMLEEAGWKPITYLWNDAQTDAVKTTAGARVPVTWIDADGVSQSLEYRVPNTNQCQGCHGVAPATNVLGLRTRQVNHDFDYGDGPESQIAHMDALGMFDAPLPPASEWARLPDPYADGPVEPRARAYLEANCAHCHNAEGAAGSSGLYLLSDELVPSSFGVCRSPTAAGAGSGGFSYDIVPGHPEESVMIFRMSSTVPGIKMPEMPIQLVDQRGVDVVSQWIAEMTPVGCPQP